MKAMLCKAYGPPESLVLEEVPPPPLGEDGVRIAVHAAGVNFPDVLIVQGKYQHKPEFPFAPGGEVSGEVLEVGAKVRRFRPGDRVLAGITYGGFAEQAVAPEGRVLKLPAGIDMSVAAGMLITYGTGMYALTDRARLQPGETLLVHGAAGGVGLAAVELGKAMGARVIATAGSAEKLAVAAAHGADETIDYSAGGFRDRVRELTGGNGADVIYDPVGGDVFDQSLRCIAWGGRLLVIGFASGRIPAAPANLALLKGCAIVGVFWGAWTQRVPGGNARNFERIFGWLADGKLRPHISHRFPLARAAEALTALVERRVVGKAIVEIGS